MSPLPDWATDTSVWPICTMNNDQGHCHHTRTWPDSTILARVGGQAPAHTWVSSSGQATCMCHELPGKVGPDTRFRCDVYLEEQADQADRPRARCIYCGRVPDELIEYFPTLTGEDLSAEDYVWAEEGTLNRENGHFACTECYILIGMPSGRPRWVAP